MIEFREIREIPNYEISNTGIFRNRKTGRNLKYFLSNGYERVRVTYKGNKLSLRIHRLVAQAFIPNPLNLPIINHKDGNRRNNSIDNLEWCTIEYNNLHKYGINKEQIIGLYNSKKWDSAEEFLRGIIHLDV